MKPVCLSVIVPAYNASATIGGVLEALSRQNCFQPYEVIVVDDGSTDNTAAVVTSFADVKYVRQQNAGPASARNHGARLAQGEYLAFTDSDCLPHPDWISLLMAGFAPPSLTLPARGRENSGKGNIGVVAGSYGIANPESALARCINAEILWRHHHLMPDYPKAFGSYNFCVKKSVFDAVGGFNTGYRTASGEDNDLSYKIGACGWRIYFEPQALVDHYHPTRVVKYLKEQYRHGFWRVKMYMDHPAMMRGDDYTFWKDIIEMPLVLLLLASLIASALHVMSLVEVLVFILLPFLVFEIFWSFIMTRRFFEGIFFGFVVFFRAVGRMLGFSTGILSFLDKKKKKII